MAVGTEFQISADGARTTLHAFTGSDGANPIAGLVQSSEGNFYPLAQVPDKHQTAEILVARHEKPIVLSGAAQ